MRDKIKRCPCGARPQVIPVTHGKFKTICPKCGAGNNVVPFPTRHQSVIHFNNHHGIRPDEPYTG